MKVQKIKWYHRLWNVCVTPLVVAMVITVLSVVFVPIYII